MSPILVVDLDDVLCGTTEAAAQWHNRKYNTQITLLDFHYYHWWKNPGWGTPEETAKKAEEFYSSTEFHEAKPVSGAVEAINELKKMGLVLFILTARSTNLREQTLSWINKWFPVGSFDLVYFAEDLVSVSHTAKTWTWPLKAELCLSIGATLLIDDNVENVLSCVEKKLPALPFGDYEWTKRKSAEEDRLSFEERSKEQGGQESAWGEEDIIKLPNSVQSVKNWKDVLAWMHGSSEQCWRVANPRN